MPRPFAITAASQQIELDVKGRAHVSFTVSNSSDRPIKGWANLYVQGSTAIAWFTVEPAGEHQFKPGESHQVTVRLAIPDGTSVGKYAFRLNLISGTKGSEEESTEGPEMSFEVRPPSVLPPPKQAPVFLLLLILAILLIAAVVVVVIMRGRPTPALEFVGKSVQEAARWAKANNVSLTSDLADWDLNKDLATNLHLMIIDQDPRGGNGVSRGKPLKLIFWKSAVARANGKFDFDEPYETGASTRSGADFDVVGMTNGLATLIVQRGARAAVLQGTDNNNGLAPLYLGIFRHNPLSGVEHLAVLPDDSFVLGGQGIVMDWTGGGRRQLRLAYARYDRDGRAVAGASSTRQVGETTIYSIMMTVDGSRRVLMAESVTNAPVLRFTDASVEEFLGRNVRVSDYFPPSHASFASQMLAQPDNKVILAGGGEEFCLLRYLPEGRLDPDFANGRPMDTPLQGTTWGNVEVALGPSGSLTVARTETTHEVPTFNLRLIRYRADGSEEWNRTNAFIPPGATSASRMNDSSSVHQLTWYWPMASSSSSASTAHKGRRMNLCGFYGVFVRMVSRIPRLVSNGILALSSPNQTEIQSVRYVVATDRRVTTAMKLKKVDTSRTRANVITYTNIWALLRFTAKGEPDPTFNANTVLSDTALWKGQFEDLSAMARQSDDKLLLVGLGVQKGAGKYLVSRFVIRLNPDGTRDEKFAPPYTTREIVLGQAAAAVSETGLLVVTPGDEVQWLSNGGRSAFLRVDEMPAPGSGEMRFSYLTWTTQ